jgi:hypothetical protein
MVSCKIILPCCLSLPKFYKKKKKKRRRTKEKGEKKEKKMDPSAAFEGSIKLLDLETVSERISCG